MGKDFNNDDDLTLDDYSKKSNNRNNRNNNFNNRNKPIFKQKDFKKEIPRYNPQRGRERQGFNRNKFQDRRSDFPPKKSIKGDVYYTKEQREQYKQQIKNKISDIKQEVQENLVQEIQVTTEKACDRKEIEYEEDQEIEFRNNTLHIYGVDFLSTEEIKQYFSEFNPKKVEWIDDSSCNIVFNDLKTVQECLKKLDNKEEDDENEEKKYETMEDLSRWHYLQPINKRGVDLILEARLATLEDKKPWEVKGQNSQFYNRFNTVVKKTISKKKIEIQKIKEESKKQILNERDEKTLENYYKNSEKKQNIDLQNNSQNNLEEQQNQQENNNSDNNLEEDQDQNQDQDQDQDQGQEKDDNLNSDDLNSQQNDNQEQQDEEEDDDNI